MIPPVLSELGVVVVDDNRHMRKLLESMLNAINIRKVALAESGLQALDLIKSLQPGIVITDADMSPMNGLELVQRLRSLGAEGLADTPVIMVTGHCERHWVEAARDAGVNEFLAKPVSISVLQLRLAEVVLKPRGFVRSERFIGPDRRRRAAADSQTPARRKSDGGAAS